MICECKKKKHAESEKIKEYHDRNCVLKCMYTNMRSIMSKNKREETVYRLYEHKVDILGVTVSGGMKE